MYTHKIQIYDNQNSYETMYMYMTWLIFVFTMFHKLFSFLQFTINVDSFTTSQ